MKNTESNVKVINKCWPIFTLKSLAVAISKRQQTEIFRVIQMSSYLELAKEAYVFLVQLSGFFQVGANIHDIGLHLVHTNLYPFSTLQQQEKN